MNFNYEPPEKGYVEFVANFVEGDKLKTIHEISEFHFNEGKWFYIDGRCPKSEAIHTPQKIGRNSVCPCGSQKKFKNCHGVIKVKVSFD